MKLDLVTMAFIEGIILITQVIVLAVQYEVNKAYTEIKWWLHGALFMAIGVFLMPLFYIEKWDYLARVANPTVMLGHIFLYIGIVRFFKKKEKKLFLALLYLLFLGGYYSMIYVHNSIMGRVIMVNTMVAILSFITGAFIYRKEKQSRFISEKFTGMLFYLYGVYAIIRVLVTLILPPRESYDDIKADLVVSFVLTTIFSTLWTFGFIVMLNQRLNFENMIEKEKMKMIFNTSPDASMIYSLEEGTIVDVNKGFQKITGYLKEEVIEKKEICNEIWVNNRELIDFIEQVKQSENGENLETYFRRKDKSEFIGIVSARIMNYYNQQHIIFSIRDITDKKMDEKALIESEKIHRSILYASPDDITITDLKGRILMVSPAGKKMFGYDEDYQGFVGKQLTSFILPEEVEIAKENIIKLHQDGIKISNEYHGVRRDKSVFSIEVNGGIISDVDGKPTKMVFIIRDITERKQTEEKIQLLIQQLEVERNIAQINAITDSLTGLFNRRYFDEILKTEFYRLKRSKEIISLIMLDVDFFKKYNDHYGHLTGDECLRQIGTMLKHMVNRAPDVVARYGGEEFIIILPKTDEEGAKTIAEKIRRGVEELAIPHELSEISPYITVSVGVVTAQVVNYEIPEQIISQADEAMYLAKEGGRNRIVTQNIKSMI